MRVRRFEVCDREPHPSAIYGDIYVNIDDWYTDDIIVMDAREKIEGLGLVAVSVVNQIRNNINHTTTITCSTDTVFKILEAMGLVGWRWAEVELDPKTGWKSNSGLTGTRWDWMNNNDLVAEQYAKIKNHITRDVRNICLGCGGLGCQERVDIDGHPYTEPCYECHGRGYTR